MGDSWCLHNQYNFLNRLTYNGFLSAECSIWSVSNEALCALNLLRTSLLCAKEKFLATCWELLLQTFIVLHFSSWKVIFERVRELTEGECITDVEFIVSWTVYCSTWLIIKYLLSTSKYNVLCATYVKEE